jgi:hypothetical protein
VNAKDPVAVALAPLLRDIFGAPAGEGYTREMLDQVAEYQTSVGLGPDGIVGRNTRLALEKQGYLDASSGAGLWPSDTLDGPAQSEHYVRLVGATAPSARPLLIGLRGVYPRARRLHRLVHAMRYDDSFVLLVAGQRPEVFCGATHAYQTFAAHSPDGGVGSIRPGTYLLRVATEKPIQFHLLTPDGKGDIPAWRDTDHNGFISAGEMEAALNAKHGQQVNSNGMFTNQVLFHPGYDDREHPRSSIACQTASRSRLQLLRQAGSELDYVLVNAADVVPKPAGVV